MELPIPQNTEPFLPSEFATFYNANLKLSCEDLPEELLSTPRELDSDEIPSQIFLEAAMHHNVLSYNHMKNGLHTIGANPMTLKYCFLHVNISSLGLIDIGLLAKYNLLVNVDMSNNSITNSQVLQHLPMLTNINASKNKLTTCLDYLPPHCTPENAWSDGQLAVGSVLTFADLSENNIAKLNDLSQHRYLECLVLHHNSIQFIDGIQGLNYLLYLDLSYNQLTIIENLANLNIQELNLEGNQIKQVSGLNRLRFLRRLNLSKNGIISIESLAANPSLQELNLSHNSISLIRQLEHLKELPNLTSLAFDSNPCSSKQFYRLRCLYILRKLLLLDGVNASPIEKLDALNLYNDDEGELGLRLQAHHEEMQSNEVFVDYSYEFVDDERVQQ